jgi:hypothetical protein
VKPRRLVALNAPASLACSCARRLAVLALLGSLASPAVAAPSAVGPERITLSIGETPIGPAIPSDFLGLSYEVKDLPLVASLASRGNYVSLLRSLGTGVLRFGGVTADSQVAWLDPPSAPPPRWATTALTPADLYQLAGLVQATGWRVVLTLNLVHFDPAAAADEARVAHEALGDSLQAVEFGNEPTAYVGEHLRAHYSFALYAREVASYRRVIAAAVPGLPIDGPDNEPLASNRRNLRWARDTARQLRPAVLTGHLYGASKCSRRPPTAKLLLSQQVRDFDQTALAELTGVSREAGGLPVWLDETNNISCGGQPGVSDRYVAALWALDLLTRILRPPFVGAAFHGFLAKPDGYTPIAASTPADLAIGHLSTRPEWYALELAHEVMGDQPLPVRLQPANPGVAVWAGRSPSGSLHLIVVNEQSRAVRVRLGPAPPGGLVSVQRLEAASLSATLVRWREVSARGAASVAVGAMGAALLTGAQ